MRIVSGLVANNAQLRLLRYAVRWGLSCTTSLHDSTHGMSGQLSLSQHGEDILRTLKILHSSCHYTLVCSST